MLEMLVGALIMLIGVVLGACIPGTKKSEDKK